jgi:dTDP-L-rhamnose 4-epimerase
MNKKILITGGAGFIGSSLALKLTEQGHVVRVLDSLSEQVHGVDFTKSFTYKLIKDKVEFIKGNILSVPDVIKSLQGINILIHMAAETGTGQSMYDVTLHTNSNING